MDSALAGCRILIVEDEMLVMMQAVDLLVDLGCRTAAAATVDKALALIAEKPFDAAMVDMNLGGEMAFRVTEALTARGVPFLFATGYVGDGLSSTHGERPVLQKPYRPNHLTEALTQLISSNSPRD